MVKQCKEKLEGTQFDTEMFLAPDAVGPSLVRSRAKITYFPIESWNINSNPAINQIEIFSSPNFPGNGCNNNVIRLCLVTINALDSVHANDLVLYPVRFTTKRREILLTYLTLCRLREETKVCGR